MKRFLCVLASCLIVAAVPAAANDGIGLYGMIESNGTPFKVVSVNKDDKIDKDKIVGTWEAKKLAPGLGLPNGKSAGTTWEFENDGTVEVSIENVKLIGPDGKEIEFPRGGIIGIPSNDVATGKYKVDGNKLTMTITLNGKGNKKVIYKTTIKKLTDKELQTEDEKGKVCEFTKK